MANLFYVLLVLFSFSANAQHPNYDSRFLVPSFISQSVALAGGCSGVVVKKGFVATAAHCVIDDTEVQVMFLGGRVSKFKVVRIGWTEDRGPTLMDVDIASDWAILSGDTGSVAPIKLATADEVGRLEMGAAISWNPVGARKGQKAIPVHCTALEMYLPGVVLVYHAVLLPGDSGSPFIGPNGKLYGLVNAHATNYSHVGWGVSAATISYVIKDLK